MAKYAPLVWHPHLLKTSLRGAQPHEREMRICLSGTILRGAIRNAAISMDTGSKWIATNDSEVTLCGDLDEAQIDAIAGVTIIAYGQNPEEVILPSGGKLIIHE